MRRRDMILLAGAAAVPALGLGLPTRAADQVLRIGVQEDGTRASAKPSNPASSGTVCRRS